MPGAKFAGKGSSPGTIKVIVPEGVKDPVTGVYKPDIEVDLHGMLKADGIDPSQVDMKYNDEATAVEDSPLGFVDRMKYEIARKPVDKARFLKNKFGAENMKYDANSARFKVQQDGVWYDADSTGLAGFLGGEGDVIAGAVAGAAKAAPLGAAAGPLGVAAAGAVGAGVGAVVSRFASMKAAEQAGLRTEQDASETAKELAVEGIMAMAGEGAAPAVKFAGKVLINKLSRSVSKIAQTATSDAARYTIAEVINGASKVPTSDVVQWLDRPDQVAKHQSAALDFLRGPSKGQGYNPVKKEMAEVVQDAVSSIKNEMNTAFQVEDVKLQGFLKDVKVDMMPIKSMTDDMAAGLLDEIRDYGDLKSARQIKQTVQFVQKGLKPEMSHAEARKILSGVDDILEAAGQYDLGPREITTKAKGRIASLRKMIDEMMISAVEKRDPNVAARYRIMNDSYSTQRELIDDIARKTRDENIDSVVKRLTGETGARELDSLTVALKRAGKDPLAFKNELFDRKAALNSVNLFKDPSVGVMAGTVMSGGLMSPRHGPKMSAKAFNALQGVAKANNFVMELPRVQREEMLRNPTILRTVQQITMQAIQNANAGGDALLQDALQSTMPTPTPLLPQEEE